MIYALRARANKRRAAIALRVAMAAAERVDPGCLARVLQLTLLAPDIVEAILDGRRADLALPALPEPFPAEWASQTGIWGQGRLAAGRRLVRQDQAPPFRSGGSRPPPG